MSIKPGQTYRNRLGAVLTIERHAAMAQLQVIGDIWLGETPDKLFGPRSYLVTEQGLKDAGYEKVSES